MYEIKVEIKGKINSSSEPMLFDEEGKKAFLASVIGSMSGNMPLEMKKKNKIILIGPELMRESQIELTITEVTDAE